MIFKMYLLLKILVEMEREYNFVWPFLNLAFNSIFIPCTTKSNLVTTLHFLKINFAKSYQSYYKIGSTLQF